MAADSHPISPISRHSALSTLSVLSSALRVNVDGQCSTRNSRAVSRSCFSSSGKSKFTDCFL
jgi:hypothetical protein